MEKVSIGETIQDVHKEAVVAKNTEDGIVNRRMARATTPAPFRFCIKEIVVLIPGAIVNLVKTVVEEISELIKAVQSVKVKVCVCLLLFNRTFKDKKEVSVWSLVG